MAEVSAEEFSGFTALPDVPLLEIFSYLGVRDKLRCSQVCRKWYSLVFTPSPWRTLRITFREGKWGRSELNYHDSKTCCELHVQRNWLLLDGCYLKVVDSLFPYHETLFDELEMDWSVYQKVITEYRLLIGCLENILPKVGPIVKHLFLNANGGVSDFIFNLFLILCPNIQNIDARFTGLSGKAFHGLSQYGSCRKLKVLNLMGCQGVNDITLRNLTECWNTEAVNSAESSCIKSIDVPYRIEYTNDVCTTFITGKEYVSEYYDKTYLHPKNVTTFLCPPSSNYLSSGLKILCLAGCSQVTDAGLEYLAKCKYVSSLELLDVSGCSGLTSKGLNVLARSCPQLKPCNLFYCALISDGPFSEKANGCQTEGGECCMN